MPEQTNNFPQTQKISVDESIRRERGSPITTRDWEGYPSTFGVSRKPETFWEGKTLLDVGSGDKWHDPEDTFPGATVYALDPEFGKLGRIKFNTAHVCTPGVVQHMPFPDSMFDFVFSSHAVPQHIYPVDMREAILEMTRVLKPTGEIRLAPCVPREMLRFSRSLKDAGYSLFYNPDGIERTITVVALQTPLQTDAPKKTAHERLVELLVEE